MPVSYTHLEQADAMTPSLLVIDSIQTMYTGDIDAAPGSVSQVRECTSRLLRFCKERNIPTVIIGHVTKEGNIAGPRMLEHMVDEMCIRDRHQGQLNQMRLLHFLVQL